MESRPDDLNGVRAMKKKKKTMESTISEELIDTSPMESLPTEILQKILGYLPFNDKIRAERVCKRWKNISTKEVWKGGQKLHIVRSDGKSIKIRLEPIIRQRSEYLQPKTALLLVNYDELKVIHSLLSRVGQNIEELTFESNFFGESSENALSMIANYCHNIETMGLLCIKDSDVEAFARLLRVNENMNSFTCEYTKDIIEILPLRDWKSLYISNYLCVDEMEEENQLLTALIEHSPSLKNLEVPFLTRNILLAASNCKQLKTLSFLEFSGRPVFNEKMNFTPLLSHLKLLEYFCQDEKPYGDNQIIDLLRHHCPNLEQLSLMEPPADNFFPLELENAVLALPKLKTLILDGTSITDENLSRLPKLKTFCLRHCGQYTENGLFEMIINSEYLEELNISDAITVNLLKRLVENTRERSKILKIVIPSEIHGEALNVCKNSKIHLIQKLKGSRYFY